MSGSCHYSRALLKLSGNALASDDGLGFHQPRLRYIAEEIAASANSGCSIAVVVGAGNIIRGASFSDDLESRLNADNAGMIATMVNGLVLKQSLAALGVSTHVCSALPVSNTIGGFDLSYCSSQLDNGTVVILTGGTGNPLFTTDTAAVLRAVQLDMDIVLKATRVDGVYSGDPEQDTSSIMFTSLTYEQVIRDELGIMDTCAIALCREHSLPIRVFNFRCKGNLKRALAGRPIGTLIGDT